MKIKKVENAAKAEFRRKFVVLNIYIRKYIFKLNDTQLSL